jgi:hypothetical protein
MVSSSTVPGMIYPEQKGMIGSTPAQSAMLNGNNKAESQANANRLMAGGRIKRRYRGGAVTVPQFPNSNSSSSDTNKLIAGNSQTATQMSENSKYDASATKMGGSRRKRGGNPNWVWGCMSGGKRKSKSRKSKSRKSKSRKSRKSKRKY